MTTRVEAHIFWRDNEREPLKAVVKSWDISEGVISLEMPDDLLPPGVETKFLHYPLDLIYAVETFYINDEVRPSGYREDSTFREVPGSTRLTGAAAGPIPIGSEDAKRK